MLGSRTARIRHQKIGAAERFEPRLRNRHRLLRWRTNSSAPASAPFAASPTGTATQAAIPSPTAVPGDNPAASGIASSRIGVGHLVAPHQDKGYIAFFDIRQPPGLQSDLSHQGGFVYMLEGSVRI